jgi:hypothetical protein
MLQAFVVYKGAVPPHVAATLRGTVCKQLVVVQQNPEERKALEALSERLGDVRFAARPSRLLASAS